MDFTATRKWLEKKMQGRDDDLLDFGGVFVMKDLTGKLQVSIGTEIYSMDRVPAEVFDKLSAGIKTFRDLGTDDPESDRTPEEQAAFDFLSM